MVYMSKSLAQALGVDRYSLLILVGAVLDCWYFQPTDAEWYGSVPLKVPRS
jgi:hypothetical protein